jgi:hypothetical protein
LLLRERLEDQPLLLVHEGWFEDMPNGGDLLPLRLRLRWQRGEYELDLAWLAPESRPKLRAWLLPAAM